VSNSEEVKKWEEFVNDLLLPDFYILLGVLYKKYSDIKVMMAQIETEEITNV